MKISATTKLVTVWTATLLIVGGITVSVWHTKPPKQEMSEPREQSIKTSEIARDTSGYKKSSPKVLQPAQTNVASSQTDSTVVDSPMSEDADMAEWDAFLEEMSNSESSEETIPEPQEECFFGLTKAEIEAKIDVLEAEIRTSLTRAVFLYKDLRSTDGMAGNSPEIAEWRDETWAEVKRLFQDVARSKVPTYVSYLKVTGGDNPLVEGGWIYELMEPLPMGITYGGTSP